jgi:hypothetical protein
MIKCKHLVCMPKDNVLRQLGTLDKCIYANQVKGLHFTYNMQVNKDCPFCKICKHYEEENVCS